MPARPRAPEPPRRRLARLALRVTALAALAGAPALGGCYGRGRNAPLPQEATTVRVRNQSFLDHNVFVLQSGSRARLGTVTGNSVAVLRIPASFVQPGVTLRFFADPIGGNATPVSDQLVVTPGDEVELIIPPR
jgi:hypothetical protein